MAYKWPDLTPMTHTDFLHLAHRYNFTKHGDVDNVWMRLVEVAKGAKYNVSNARAEVLTYGEIGAVILKGRHQFRGMSDNRWEVALTVGLRLCSELPSYREISCSYEMLKSFIERQRLDPKLASRLWTVLVRDGLGIFQGFSGWAKPFWVPKHVIRTIAASNPSLHRNLGEGLLPILQEWCKTF